MNNAEKILTIGLIIGAVLVIAVLSVSAMLVKVGPHTCADMGMDLEEFFFIPLLNSQ